MYRTLLAHATTLAVVATALATVPPAPAAAQETVIQVGDAAPPFEAIADDGTIWRSADHVGESLLVVYFYPAAMTSGCTTQACAFRDNRSRLAALGATVVGVSGDRVENLQMFKRTNRLNFPLLSDADGEVARAFGVPVREGGTITKNVDGHEVELTRDVTTARWTFIIGRDGTVLYRETEADPEGDSEAVIEFIQQRAR